ncbi:MAG: bifunctional nuclease family protein [Bacteroidetes bacterium]|nr:bifunctional nuclease family protein [Bacteroidota bacterium]
MKKIKLEIIGLSFSQTQSGAYALILGEEEGKRRLPIIIGGFEAQAIAVELENMQPSRPLTHDLFKNFAIEFDIHIDEIIIYNLKEGIFYSKLICTNKEGESKEIDARTSDAIAMAVRFNCPIYSFEFILSSAGMVLDETEGATEEEKPKSLPKKSAATKVTEVANDYTSLSVEELKELLMKAIDEEAYETASKIRDELSKRKKSSEQ